MRMRFLDPDHPGDEDLGKAYPLTIFLTAFLLVRIFLEREACGFALIRALLRHGFYPEDKTVPTRIEQTDPMLLSESETATGRLERLALFAKVSFGGVPYTNLVFMVKKGIARPANNNCVGLGFLSRNLVTFNFPKRIMYLKPVTTRFLLKVV